MLTSLAINTGGLGRFGNNCFTIAGVIGTAIKSGQPYAFPPWITKDNEIFGEAPDNINDYLATPLPALPGGMRFDSTGYFWGWRDLYLPNGNWTIDAHMQSERFFKHCLPLIRETFRFKDEPEQKEWIAIHVRFGDYIDHPDAQHPVCDKEYYEKAIALFPRCNMIVFSDDFEKASDMFEPLIGYGRVVRNRSYIDDFKLMKRCKHFITANSSFSLFAAILGEHPDKKIVCPRRWFGSQMPAEFGTEDIYPENAIIT